MRVLVFIPMYNCAAQISRVLDQLRNPEIAAFIGGVVCVDNRSTDGTVDVAKEALQTVDLPSRVLLQNDENYGLGGSHKVAINFAREEGFDHLIVLHGDDQGAVADILPSLNKNAHESVDFLMGARFMKASKLEGYAAIRTFANIAFNAIFSVVSGQKLYDLGSGLNMFRVSAFDDDFHLKFADDLTFNYYLILAIAARRHPLLFFPLTWREEDQVSNARLSRMGMQILRLLIQRISNRDQFLAGEHREKPRTAYPSTLIKRWDA